MVFGVFDRLHKGHLYFLDQAKKYGQVIAVVARDDTVAELKKRAPLQSERQRINALKGLVAKAVWGDKVQGSYAVLKRYRPDIICLGYDQGWLKNDLEEKMKNGLLPKIKLIQLTPHWPEELHSSLLDLK